MKPKGTTKFLKIQQKVGKRVEDLIASRGYPSLENFALSNGFHKATVHQVVKGVVDPRLSTLIRLAEALEVPLERLVGGLGS